MFPPLLMAPMLDITNRAFRTLVRGYGGCGLFYTEMLNARRLPTESAQSPFWQGLGVERDVMVQLLGDDPEALARSVERLLPLDPFGFDWNLGCARKKITHWGWGAALLENPQATARGLRALRQATDKPLTVKIRLPEHGHPDLFKSFIKLLENEGVDAITVHARTAADGFKRPARWDAIAQVKSWTKVPVIGNGDVQSAADAQAMFQKTGCDAVMIGRGAVGKPYLFKTIINQASGATEPAPEAAKVLEAMLTCLDTALETPKGAREFKVFCRYFAQTLPVPHWFWAPLQSMTLGPELAKRARVFFKK
ncbi:MAG: tRNA-dihydrouridine synthase family protein [Candidatus Firestonebacteria bacterium]|nr:tRNA-dihydrouridine synthase family protein [Candidatus Firestonebacteria bacterium]